jgi:uncharacterized protein YjbI with pentapeptide repeats
MRFRRTGRTGQSSPSSRPDPSPEPISQVLKDLLEELQSRRVPTRPPRDWIQIFVTALPGLAAVIALIFTWLSINATTNATNRQLQVAEQGQVTDRYNAAITNLGSPSVDVRLGGIYALQRIMQDSPRDQPTVIAVLCAFVRDHANAAVVKSARPSASPDTSSVPSLPPTDIQAALTVVGTRNTALDGSTTVVDFSRADLSGATLSGAHLTNANLFGAHLDRADLTGAHLDRADLSSADLTGADLSCADLITAHLLSADLSGAQLFSTDLSGADFLGADLSGADFHGADLTGADLTTANLDTVDLIDADLDRADFNSATVIGADLTHATLREANLSPAILTNANLTGANLTGATIDGTDLTYADLTGADLAHATLKDANLTDATLKDATLTGADLSGADLSGAILTGVKGLPTGTPRSPTSTPTPTKNLRRWATRLAACGLAWLRVGHRDVGHAEADRQGRQAAAGLRVVAVRAGRVVRVLPVEHLCRAGPDGLDQQVRGGLPQLVMLRDSGEGLEGFLLGAASGIENVMPASVGPEAAAAPRRERGPSRVTVGRDLASAQRSSSSVAKTSPGRPVLPRHGTGRWQAPR